MLVAAVVLSSALSSAGPAEDLLALPHRPTVAEIKKAFGGKLPESNPFGTPTEKIQARIRENAPAVIAMFEKIYPGATFAPLGRDSVFLGDVIDAFYQSLGQDRVRRVSASGNSLTGSEPDIVDFLKGAGFDVGRLNVSYPFIMFDQTNWASNSQSTRYVHAVANECKNRGCDPYLLFEKFNFINTGAKKDMYKYNIFGAEFDFKKFRVRNRAAIAKTGRIGELISVPVDAGLVYTTEYHGTFDRFKRLSDGSVVANPGAMSSNSIRLQILADVFAAVQAVSEPSFLKAVDQEARKLNYKFPRFRIITANNIATIRGIAPDRPPLEETRAAIHDGLNAAIKQKTSSLPSLLTLSASAANQEAEFQVEYLKAAIRGFDLGLVTPDEMRAFILSLLGKAQGPVAPYVRLLSKSPLLRKIWNEKVWPRVIGSRDYTVSATEYAIYANFRKIQDESSSTKTSDELFSGNWTALLSGWQAEVGESEQRKDISSRVARLIELELKFRAQNADAGNAAEKFWPLMLSEVKRAHESGALSLAETADVLAASLALSAGSSANIVDRLIDQDTVLRQALSSEQSRLYTLNLKLGSTSGVQTDAIFKRLTGLMTSQDPKVARLKNSLLKVVESELRLRVFDGLTPLSHPGDENTASANWHSLKAALDRQASINPDFLAASSRFLFESIERLHNEGRLAVADVREFLIYIVEAPVLEGQAQSDAIAAGFKHSLFMRSELERHLIWFRDSKSPFVGRFVARTDLGFGANRNGLGVRYLRSLKPNDDAINGGAHLDAIAQLVHRLDGVQDILADVANNADQDRLSELERAMAVYELAKKQMLIVNGPVNLLWLTDVSPRMESLLLKAKARVEADGKTKVDRFIHALLVAIKYRSKQMNLQPIDLMRAANELSPSGSLGSHEILRTSNEALQQSARVNRIVLEALAASAVATIEAGTSAEKKWDIALALIESSLSAFKGLKISHDELVNAVRTALLYGVEHDKVFISRFNTLYTYHKELRDAMASIAAGPQWKQWDIRFEAMNKKTPGSCTRALRRLIGI
jgi:hypothetical protein